jgi:hypothetical protein
MPDYERIAVDTSGRGRGHRLRANIAPAAALALAASLSGCGTGLQQTAPHPDRPEVVSGRLETDRVPSGCPVRLFLNVRDLGANVVRALASWSYEGTSEGAGARPVRVLQDGFAAVPFDATALAGQRDGEIAIVLTPLQPGQYRYAVQLEDAAGHRSNVMAQSFSVLPQPAGAPVSCSEPLK